MENIFILLLSIVFLLIYIIFSGIIRALVCYAKELSVVNKAKNHLESLDAFYATPWDDKDKQKDLDQWKKKSL